MGTVAHTSVAREPVRSDIVIRAHANQRADTFLTPAVALAVDHTGAYVAVFVTLTAAAGCTEAILLTIGAEQLLKSAQSCSCCVLVTPP